jgi:hypothetical protein
MRQRYGELLRAEVAETVESPDGINEELRYLVSIIREGRMNPGNVGGEML